MERATYLTPKMPNRACKFKILLILTGITLVLLAVATAVYVTVIRKGGVTYSRRFIGLNIRDLSGGSLRWDFNYGECDGIDHSSYDSSSCGTNYTGCAILYENEVCNLLTVINTPTTTANKSDLRNETNSEILPTAFDLEPLTFGRFVSMTLRDLEWCICSFLKPGNETAKIMFHVYIPQMMQESINEQSYGRESANKTEQADSIVSGIQDILEDYLSCAHDGYLKYQRKWKLAFNYTPLEASISENASGTYSVRWKSINVRHPLVHVDYSLDGKSYIFDVDVSKRYITDELFAEQNTTDIFV